MTDDWSKGRHHEEQARLASRRLNGRLAAIETLFGAPTRAALEQPLEDTTEHLAEAAHFYKNAAETYRAERNELHRQITALNELARQARGEEEEPF